MKASRKNFYAYNKRLTPLAGDLRKNMTKAEACLWKYALKSKMRRGHGFRRQRPVLNYIADFMCKELKLIIEVDGITHTWEETIQHDRIREEKLKHAGFHILRFDDDEVLEHINTVIEVIDRKIEELEKVLLEK